MDPPSPSLPPSSRFLFLSMRLLCLYKSRHFKAASRKQLRQLYESVLKSARSAKSIACDERDQLQTPGPIRHPLALP
jgi:hypothetical protein